MSLPAWLSVDNMNPNLVRMQFTERGPLPLRAHQLQLELEQGMSKPFRRVISADLGDAQAMGQAPITFVRQVIACCTYPELVVDSDFPQDVKQRASQLLAQCSGSLGAYSASTGVELIRRHVAEYLERRDGFPAHWPDVCLTTGATNAIRCLLKLFINEKSPKPNGVLIPTPQCPLYASTLAEFGLAQEPYHMDEERGWSLQPAELERARTAARSNVRAIVVINPGNPTGSVLTRTNIEDVIKFAYHYRLFVLADEVYQDNVYEDQFHSFKKVLREMGEPYSSVLELASVMSLSKGYVMECGLRAGFLELVNVDAGAQEQFYKLLTTLLSPPLMGQIGIDCLVRPPSPGEPSHEQWARERGDVLQSLRERARSTVSAFNSVPGVSCCLVQGALYAFPRVLLPARAAEAAAERRVPPDVYYATELLEETGICVIPGPEFGQKPGTFHFRCTILPPADLLQEMMNAFRTFHEKFIIRYS